MSVYKIARCPECKKRTRLNRTPRNQLECGCGSIVVVSDDWYILAPKQMKIGPNKAMAEAAKSKYLTNIAEGRANLNKRLDCDWDRAKDMFEDFLETQVAAKEITSSTEEFYLKNLKKLNVSFSGYKLSQIGIQSVNSYIKSRVGVVSGTTINREITTLKRLMNWAESSDMIEGNVFSSPKAKNIISFEENAKTRHLTFDEQQKLLKACSHKSDLYLAVMLALNTGLRRSDIMSLEWSEVDLSSRWINRNRIAKKRMKDGEVSPKPMTSDLVDAIARYKKNRSTVSRWVFPNPNDPRKHITDEGRFGFETVRDNLVKKGMGHFTFHDLRRTFATRCAERGVPLETTQEILDHSDIRITRQIYIQVDRKKLQGDFRAFGN